VVVTGRSKTALGRAGNRNWRTAPDGPRRGMGLAHGRNAACADPDAERAIGLPSGAGQRAVTDYVFECRHGIACYDSCAAKACRSALGTEGRAKAGAGRVSRSCVSCVSRTRGTRAPEKPAVRRLGDRRSLGKIAHGRKVTPLTKKGSQIGVSALCLASRPEALRGIERWVERNDKHRDSSAGLTVYLKPETLPALAHTFTWTDFAWQKSNSY
jgi:hypothetical protein